MKFAWLLASWFIMVNAWAGEPLKQVTLDETQLAKLKESAFQAARTGDVKTLTEYFALKRSINEVNSRGDTLLIVAAYNGQSKAVLEILKQPNVEVDAKNKLGFSPLMAAAFKGELEIAKALVKAGANVNFKNTTKQTALMYAALSGKVPMVQWLLDQGADPEATDANGRSALTMAETQDATDVIKLLKRKTKPKKE